MAIPAQPIPQYSFGVFTVDTRSGELRKQGTRVKLQERPFQLLVALVERPGEVVTREELRRRLWTEGTFVDFDHNISSCVNKLRSALDDSSTHPRFIETVGRRGYRFLAGVKAIATAEEMAEPTPVGTAPSRMPAFRRWLLLACAAAVLVIVPVAVYLRWTQSRVRPPARGKVMLAVLPFENLTGDSGQDYFSDGLTEEMITQLGRLDPQRIGVIARTSVMHYKLSPAPLEQIRRDLGVQYVLQGSVRRSSGKVRIAAQLIQLQDQTQLWAREYDRELKDLLLVQGEIAREISDEIRVALGDHRPVPVLSQSSLSPQALEAYNLYLQGLYFWNKRTVAGFKEAINYFQQATEKDPNCARAYAGLADSYALIGGYSGIPQAAFREKARAAASRAVAIDPGLPEAHTALALIVEIYDWDWDTAEKEFQRAIALDPNYATAHHWYAEHLTWRGRFDEALHESERAQQLDPLSLIIAADRGVILYYARRNDQAIEQFQYVLHMEPNFPRASVIVSAYVQEGRFDEAIATQRAIEGPSGGFPWYWGQMAYTYGRAGRQTEAQRLVNQLLQYNRRQPVDPMVLAFGYLGLGNKQQALAALERAYAQRSNALTSLKVDPIFDPLRSDPRFQDLLRRVGLAD